MAFDDEWERDTSFHVVIGELPSMPPAWERVGGNDSLLRTHAGLYYTQGLSFTYWSRSAGWFNGSDSSDTFRPAPAMVLSLFRLGNDTFFEVHLPVGYLQRPRIAWFLQDSLGVDITTSVHVRHFVGRVYRMQGDTIEYSWAWPEGGVVKRVAQEQGIRVTFEPMVEGEELGMLFGDREKFRSLLQALARDEEQPVRGHFVRVAR
jgi:hypothetical protein